jgi:hypothetical protein
VDNPPMAPARTVGPYGTLDNVRFPKPNDVDTKLFKLKEPPSVCAKKCGAISVIQAGQSQS